MSNKPDASAISSTIEELKASRREIQSQHATIGLELSTLDEQISTLESQLREYVGRESEVMRTSDTINLNVKNQNGRVVCFTMKRRTRMKKLVKAWCDQFYAHPEDVVFKFDTLHLRADQTPEQLHMQNGDEIIALLRIRGS